MRQLNILKFTYIYIFYYIKLKLNVYFTIIKYILNFYFLKLNLYSRYPTIYFNLYKRCKCIRPINVYYLIYIKFKVRKQWIQEEKEHPQYKIKILNLQKILSLYLLRIPTNFSDKIHVL